MLDSHIIDVMSFPVEGFAGALPRVFKPGQASCTSVVI